MTIGKITVLATLAGMLAAPVAWASIAQSDSGASARGAGHITINGARRTFSFTVSKDAEGNVTGKAQLQARQSGIQFWLDLNCLSIVGNTATVSGTLRRSDVGFWEGASIWFRVTDNGNGPSAAPDKITLVAYFLSGAGPTCDQNVNLTSHPIEGGNIQIRQ